MAFLFSAYPLVKGLACHDSMEVKNIKCLHGNDFESSVVSSN